MTVNVRSSPLSSAIARSLAASQARVTQTTLRLASGVRVNKAADDVAAVVIGESLRAQIQGAGQAIRNAKDATSLAQTADGALASVQHILQRLRQLAVQALHDGVSRADREALQSEVTQLQLELNRSAQDATFNGQRLLDGSFAARRFHVGAQPGQTVALAMQRSDLGALGLDRVSSSFSDNSLAAARGSLAPNPRVSGQLDTDLPVGSSLQATGTILDELGNDVAVRATYTRQAPTSVTSSSWTVTLRLDEDYTRTGINFAAGTLLAQGTVTFNGARGDTGQNRGNVTSPTPPAGITGTTAARTIAGRPFVLDLALTQIDDDDGVINQEVAGVPSGSALQGGTLSAGSNDLNLTTGIAIDNIVLDNAGFLAFGTTPRVGLARQFQVLDRNGNTSTATLRFERPPVPNDVNNDGIPDDVLPAAAATTTASVQATLDAGELAFTDPFDPADPIATSHLRGTTSFFDSRGVSHLAELFFRKTGGDAWEWHALVDGASVSGGTPGTGVVVARGTLTFDPLTGAQLTSTQNSTVRFHPVTAGATQNQLISFNMSTVTQSAAASSLTSITRNGSQQGDGIIDGVAPDANRWDVTIRSGTSTSGSLWARGTVQFASDGAGGYVTQSASIAANSTGKFALGTDFQIAFGTSSVTAGGAFSSTAPTRTDTTVHRPGSIVVTGSLDTDMAAGDSRLISRSPPPEILGTDGSLTPIQVRAIRLSSASNTAQWDLRVEQASTGVVLGTQRITYVATEVDSTTSLTATTPSTSLHSGLFNSGGLTSFSSGVAFQLNLGSLRRLHDITDPVGPATVLPAPVIIGEPPLSGLRDLAAAASNRLVAQTLTITGVRAGRR